MNDEGVIQEVIYFFYVKMIKKEYEPVLNVGILDKGNQGQMRVTNHVFLVSNVHTLSNMYVLPIDTFVCV